ncbi:MAG: Ig-like domain-containing protein [Gemmatimonadaceae bacterium]
MRHLIALVLLAGCASTGAPPGGPERHTPPEIVAINPDSGARSVAIKEVEFKFDEVVSDRANTSGGMLDGIFLVSPRTGAPEVSWHRTRITVRPRGGFRANTAYSITMLPGLVDLRGNARKESRTIVFSTGATFPSFSILGRVFDWSAQRPVANAYVEAISQSDTTVVYLATTDTLGQFDAGPLPSGTYLVRGLIDQNGNRVLDRNEKWDTTTAVVTNVRGYYELDAIERDSTPPHVDNVQMIDSTTIRVSFDKPIDPGLPLQPALVRVQRSDSTELQVTRVQWASTYDAAHLAFTTDSVKRADSVRTASQPKRAGVPPAPTPSPSPIPLPGGARNPPPPPKPKSPAPEKAIVISLSPTTPVVPTKTYVFTGNGFRNLVGHADRMRGFFTPPKPIPRDTTTKKPAVPAGRDTTKPPGAKPPR